MISRRRKRADMKFKRKCYRKKEENGDFSFINLYKMGNNA
jgi:hypothetical protein